METFSVHEGPQLARDSLIFKPAWKGGILRDVGVLLLALGMGFLGVALGVKTLLGFCG